jgi:DNA topoisomerase IB
VHRRHGTLVFEYVAKSGVPRTERIDDPVLLASVGTLMRRRSGDPDELLVYRDGPSWHRLTSDDINSYVKEVVRLEVSAMDFRTWHRTVLASVALADEFAHHPAERPWTRTALDTAVRRSVQAVAENLGNTPSVCRGSYINPRVTELFREGVTIDRAVSRVRRAAATDKETDDRLSAELLPLIGAAPTVERAVLKLLDR